MTVDASATTVPAAPAAPAARAEWAHRVLQAAVLLAPAALILVLGWQRRWMDEDAFINLRIVDQIFAGHGPVFNGGERVEAYTSVLWLGVLALARGTLGQIMAVEWATVIAASRRRSEGSRSARTRGGGCTPTTSWSSRSDCWPSPRSRWCGTSRPAGSRSG